MLSVLATIILGAQPAIAARDADVCTKTIEKLIVLEGESASEPMSSGDRNRMLESLKNQAELIAETPMTQRKAPVFLKDGRLHTSYVSTKKGQEVELIATTHAIVLGFKVKGPGEDIRYRCITELAP